jgi:hypothetical protein
VPPVVTRDLGFFRSQSKDRPLNSLLRHAGGCWRLIKF